MLRCLLFLVLISITCHSIGQKYYVDRKRQMFLGLSGGANFSFVNVTAHHHVLTPMNSITDEEERNKQYGKMGSNAGGQIGLYFKYGIARHISVVSNPSFQVNQFRYLTSYNWADTLINLGVEREILHQQKINSIIVPISVRYDFTINQISPYAHFGPQLHFLQDANKAIYFDDVIDGEVDIRNSKGTSGNVNAKKHFNHFNFGFLSGAGVSYYSNYFTLSFETNVSFGLRKIVNDEHRYKDYTGFTLQYFDVLDQLRMGSLALQLTAVFPIDTSVKLSILKKSRN
ncbi:MAG: outer membrane beta-barrel protein [Crocinitomicaceae bacterium]|nr:outer membrane beta-barrel protein [Crocinitomicaceae bacterium]